MIRKGNHSLSRWTFSPVICQFWLGTAKFCEKIISSKCSSGHVEASFHKIRRKIFAHFFSRILPNPSYFSHSGIFSLQFIEAQSNFFSEMVIHKKMSAGNKSTGSNPTTVRPFQTFFTFSSTSTRRSS